MAPLDPRTWTLVANRLRRKLRRLLLIGKLLNGTGLVDQHHTPNQGIPITHNSPEWEILEEAAELAFKHALRVWGPQFCRTIANWFGNVSHIYLFHTTQTTSGTNCTGMTFYSRPPTIHITLKDQNGNWHPIHTIAAILLHEIAHLREQHIYLPDLTEIINQIRKLVQEYLQAGVLDPITYLILQQDERETIPWTTELTSLGTLDHRYEKWGHRYPTVLNYALAQGTHIAPPLAHPRTTTIQPTTATSMTTSLTTTIQPTTTDNPPKGICYRPDLGPSYPPTDPLTRGVLKWLKHQAQDALHNPQHQWHTCTHEYQQLISGTHPDPNPGKIITPDNPDSFHPDQMTPNKNSDLTEEDLDLLSLPTNISVIDGHAWGYLIDDHYPYHDEENVPFNPDLFNQYCLNALQKEIGTHEEEVRRRQRAGIPLN